MTADGPLLVEDGVARVTILHWGDGSPVSYFAAQELSSYLERMTGVRIAVRRVREPGPQYGLALTSRDAPIGSGVDRCEKLLTDAHGDAYAISTIQDMSVVMLGRTERAVLYAAYDVLRQLGVRFHAPQFEQYDGHAEHVPARTSVRLEARDVLEQPSCELRRKYVEEGWSHSPRHLRALVDWMAKNRLNVLVHPYDYIGQGIARWDDVRDDLLPELRRRGILVEVGGHGYEAFLPRPGHPQFYSAGTEVFDAHHQDAVDAYATTVVDYLRDRPEIAVFDAWPPDDGDWPTDAVDAFGSVANAHAEVTNAVVRAVAVAHLDVRVEAIAYNKHVRPPSADHRLDDTVVLDFAPYDRSYGSSIFADGAPANASYRELFSTWIGQFAGTMAIYEYYRKYSWHSLPVLPVRLILDEIPAYRAAGFSGFGTYSEPDDWITYELIHLLVAELSWTVDLDGEVWLREHLRARYGGAAPDVASYLDHMERAGGLLFDRADGNYGSFDVVRAVREEYRAADAVLSESGPTGTSAAFLVDRLRENLAYAIADIDIDYYRLLGDEPGVRAAIRRTAELVERLRGKGIVVDSVWTRRRLDPGVDRESTRWLYDAYREDRSAR